MPYFLRKLRKRSNWLRPPEAPWLPDDDVHADTLKDLPSDDNALSFWLIDDSQSNLKRVLAAIAATRDFCANLDYALIETKDLEGIERRESLGHTPDSLANESWHLDFVHLTGAGLHGIARMIGLRGNVRKRAREHEIAALLKSGVASGNIALDRLSESLRARLDV